MNDTRRPMTLEEASATLNPTSIEVVEDLMLDLVSNLSVPGVLPPHVCMCGRDRPDRPDLRQLLIVDGDRAFGLSVVTGTGIPSSELGLYETAGMRPAPEGECHELPIRGGGAWWIVDSDSVCPEQTVEMILERLAVSGD